MCQKNDYNKTGERHPKKKREAREVAAFLAILRAFFIPDECNMVCTGSPPGPRADKPPSRRVKGGSMQQSSQEEARKLFSLSFSHNKTKAL